MIYDALYARQSVEKKDSISVESQLEYCRYETHGAPYLEYTDKGFSGKDTRRPAFEKMMSDIRHGKIRRVIVYKLDRISRSILDFANMMEFFQTYSVAFLSSTEKFDTDSPIGRAMLNICIVFAQLERETIQKRVADAYYARCKRGFYMGGRVPYGFRLVPVFIENVRTSMYEEIPEESAQIKFIYTMYADPAQSLGSIVRYLNSHNIRHLRGSIWNTARLSELLKNPVYVKADMDVYCFYKNAGFSICNPISDFTGCNACYLYKLSAADGKKQGTDSQYELVLAPHKGLISSKIWLTCQNRRLNRHKQTQTGKAASWLTGKLKCGRCGYALVIKKSKTKHERYFVCSHAANSHACTGTECTVYADVLEAFFQSAICRKLAAFPVLFPQNAAETSPEVSFLKRRLLQTEEEIHLLLTKTEHADAVLTDYLSEKISDLDARRQKLQKELHTLSSPSFPSSSAQITDHPQKWTLLSLEDKRLVADLLIRAIHVADEKLEIFWNISDER